MNTLLTTTMALGVVLILGASQANAEVIGPTGSEYSQDQIILAHGGHGGGGHFGGGGGWHGGGWGHHGWGGGYGGYGGYGYGVPVYVDPGYDYYYGPYDDGGGDW